MERIRPRIIGFAEWAAAAACVLAVLILVAGVAREFRIVRPIVAVNAAPARTQIIPADLRPGAISVPELVLPDGKRLAIGDPAATLAMLGPLAQSGPVVVERLVTGQRESRTYRYAGMDFVVVTSSDRIVAMYR
jgi:hypothetical protein